MTTLVEAHQRLLAMLTERRRAGLSATLDQVDCVLCEDFETVMAYAYVAGDEDPIFAINIEGEAWLPWRIERQLMRPAA